MSAEAEPAVRWTSVGLTYSGPPEVAALRPTDLVLRPGEHVAITGPSGSGKSTLMNVLGLIDRATTGRVEVDGTDVGRLSSRQLAVHRARWFGFVFQRFHLLPALTAHENVELALMYAGVRGPSRKERAASALDRVGLASRGRHRATELSGGEQQRVAIARAIACDQLFVLADEPTGSLDSRTATEILDLLDDLPREGRGLVCVTHSREVAARADRCLHVLDGLVTDSDR